jgi:hypothetical protein
VQHPTTDRLVGFQECGSHSEGLREGGSIPRLSKVVAGRVLGKPRVGGVGCFALLKRREKDGLVALPYSPLSALGPAGYKLHGQTPLAVHAAIVRMGSRQRSTLPKMSSLASRTSTGICARCRPRAACRPAPLTLADEPKKETPNAPETRGEGAHLLVRGTCL